MLQLAISFCSFFELVLTLEFVAVEILKCGHSSESTAPEQ